VKGAARPLPASPVLTSAALTRPVLARAGAAAGAALGAYTVLRRYPPGGEKTWARTNHRGESVTLLEGPAVTVGAVAAQLVTAALPALVNTGRTSTGRTGTGQRGRRPVTARDYPERVRVSAYPLAMAGLGGVAFGVIDDLRGSGKRRGLRGHLGALVHGEVTTGTVKLAGLTATGLGAALVEGGGPADIAINTGLIAGGANLLNLFDLRPGRAIKVAALAAGLIAGGSALTRSPMIRSTGAPGPDGDTAGPVPARLAGLRAVAAPAGAALALLPEDLRERAMLGDAGANALGAMLGAAAAQALPRGARLTLLTGIVALTVASEKVSFTRVIESTPPLRWLDMLGRRPVTLAVPLSGGTVPGGSLFAGPNFAGPVSVAEPVAMTRTERLAWWIRRRRPGRHRRTKAGL
jgi:UDP-GlcNAc:undecaprenyl-phosphate/decaprenyl-phosphate GlcNAc-1-phosphate transferase